MKMPTNSLPEPVFLSAPKAATLCGVSRNTICCWIRDGKMPSYRTAGGKYLIRPDELVNFMHTNGMFVPQSLLDIAKAEPKGIVPAPGTGKLPLGNEPKILVVDDDIAARDLAVRSPSIPRSPSWSSTSSCPARTASRPSPRSRRPTSPFP